MFANLHHVGDGLDNAAGFCLLLVSCFLTADVWLVFLGFNSMSEVNKAVIKTQQV